MSEKVVWSSKKNDYTNFGSSKRIKKKDHMETLADYTEDQDWRKYMSSVLGTESAFIKLGDGSGVHWVSKWPNEDYYWDSTMWEADQVKGKDVRIQHFLAGRTNDTYCSLYSLYHELQFYKEKKDKKIPNLKVSPKDGDKIEEALKFNKFLLKTYLREIANLPWSDRFDNWYGMDVSNQKKEFLRALRHF